MPSLRGGAPKPCQKDIDIAHWGRAEHAPVRAAANRAAIPEMIMFATQNAQRSDCLQNLRQRLRSFVFGTGFEVDAQNLAHHLAERLVLLGPVSTEQDIPAMARIPWSVFVSRYLGVEDLRSDTIESAQSNLRAMTPEQTTEVEPLLQDIIELINEACTHYAEVESRSFG
jgi:hypothetical protein